MKKKKKNMIILSCKFISTLAVIAVILIGSNFIYNLWLAMEMNPLHTWPSWFNTAIAILLEVNLIWIIILGIIIDE